MVTSWNSLSLNLEKEILLKGFLYFQEDGTLLLSKDPGLSSCCLRRSPHQVKLVGLSSKVVKPKLYRFQGVLQEEKDCYILSSAKEIAEFSFPYGSLFFCLFALSALWLYHSIHKKNRKVNN